MAGSPNTTGGTAAELASRRLMATAVEGCLGAYVSELGDNTAQLRMPIPRGDLARGGVGGAVSLNVIADTAGGLAICAYRAAELSGPTIELRVDRVAPPADDAGWLIADSTVSHEVAQAGYATVVVRDDTNRVLARAQGHYVLPELAAAADWSIGGGVAELGRPDALLAALRPGGSDPASWTVRSTMAMANPRAQVHGGILLAMGQLAQLRLQAPDCGTPDLAAPDLGGADLGASDLGAALDGAALDGAAMPSPMSVQVEYLRPVPTDGSEVSCRTSYVRRGRRFRTLRTELVRADGRVATIVTGLWSVGRSQ